MEKGLELNELTETAINSMLDTLIYHSDDIGKAVIEIELAADALPVE